MGVVNQALQLLSQLGIVTEMLQRKRGREKVMPDR